MASEKSAGGSAPGKGAWKALDTSSAILATVLAPRIAQLVWRLVSGRKAQASASLRNPEVGTVEAVASTAIVAAVVAVVRLLLRRGAARYWVKSTGSLPPGMKASDPLAPPTSS